MIEPRLITVKNMRQEQMYLIQEPMSAGYSFNNEQDFNPDPYPELT